MREHPNEDSEKPVLRQLDLGPVEQLTRGKGLIGADGSVKQISGRGPSRPTPRKLGPDTD